MMKHRENPGYTEEDVRGHIRELQDAGFMDDDELLTKDGKVARKIIERKEFLDKIPFKIPKFIRKIFILI